MRNAVFIARKDAQYMLKARETLLWVFVMPIVFFFMIGNITGGFSSSGGEKQKDRIAVKTGGQSGFLVDQLKRRLEEQDYQVVLTETEEEFTQYLRRLTLPENFSENVNAGTPAKVNFTRVKGGLGMDYDTIRVSRAVYTLLADIVVTSESGTPLTVEAIDQLNAIERSVTLDVSRAGERKVIPSGFEQAIPGTMVMFTMMVLLTSGAVLLVIERREGLLRRLASTPISRGEVVLGKWGGRMLLALLQIGFAMIVGTVLFKMSWGPSVPMLIVVLFAWAALNASLAIMVGTLARTEGQAIGLGVISTIAMAALGGCWWPIEVTPPWMQSAAKLLPTGWAMDAMHKLVSFGAPASSAVPHVIVMLAVALLTGAVAARYFRYQ